MSSDNGAANQTTIGFCMQYEENGIVLFGGLYGLILVPTEHFGQNDFAVGQWYSVRVQEVRSSVETTNS